MDDCRGVKQGLPDFTRLAIKLGPSIWREVTQKWCSCEVFLLSFSFLTLITILFFLDSPNSGDTSSSCQGSADCSRAGEAWKGRSSTQNSKRAGSHHGRNSSRVKETSTRITGKCKGISCWAGMCHIFNHCMSKFSILVYWVFVCLSLCFSWGSS